MDNPVPAKTVCLRCRGVLDAEDNYCRRCGTASGVLDSRSAAFPAGVESGPATPLRFWESRWIVLTLLFVVLGPFAIPLLWRSRRFTLLWKNIVTVLAVLQTVLVLWMLWVIMQQLVGPLRELEELLRR